MEIKGFSFKIIISVILSAIIFGLFSVSHSDTAEEIALQIQLKELRSELQAKARLCAQHKNKECITACSIAAKTALKNKDIDAAQPLIDQCNEHAAPFEKELAAKQDVTVLRTGWKWMQDVDAIVSKATSGRSMRLVAQAREDFHTHCRNELNRYANAEQRRAVQIGARVHLKHVQYNPNRKGLCQVGKVEILE